VSSWRLVLSSLRFYWRTHLGVLLGAALSTAVLVGALAVGDSVKFSLKSMALSRLGNVHYALTGGERFFRAQLAREIGGDLGVDTAAILQLRGTVSKDGGEARVSRVQILGVDEEFWKLGGTQSLLAENPRDSVVVNEKLARQLGVQAGDEVLLRVEKPSLLSRDAPLSTVSDFSVTLRLTVAAVADAKHFGRFSLTANQLAPYSAFVDLRRLQERVERPERANVILVGGAEGKSPDAKPVSAALARHLQLGDGDLQVHEFPGPDVVALTSGRLFLEPPVAAAAEKASLGACGVLTYFVNRLQCGPRSTPYSFVSAVEAPPVPRDMRDDEIVLNDWLAQDLNAKPGDEVRLDYFVVGSMRRLEERSSTFHVRAVVSIKGSAADRELTPAYPGLVDAEDCRDWEPGVPIDLKAIRDKDERYWDAHRATPKAFVTLAAGQRMWDNRFGNLTSVRYPLLTVTRGSLESALRSRLRPEFLGIALQPVRKQALAAATQALDFGQLFLGLSFFLIVAALVLTVLLFVFGIEQRTEEVGTLLALGLTPRCVQRLLLLEGGALALGGGLLGTFGGVAYTRLIVRALNTLWRGAVAGSALEYHATAQTLALGAVSGFVAALLSIWLAVRKQAKAPARELLSAGAESQTALLSGSSQGRPRGVVSGVAAVVIAVAIVALAGASQNQQTAGVFFGAGSLLLVGGLALTRAFLGALDRSSAAARLSLSVLGLRNTSRRQGRSLATVALLACGSFLVVAVGANRKDPAKDAERRSSGTGGFALIGESTIPVYHDLNSQAGREAFGLGADSLRQVEVVQFRVREGDDASCLNLNRAQTPRLLGVDPEELRKRGAFGFVKTLDGNLKGSRWDLLELGAQAETAAVPAIGDQSTVTWGLEKKIGDFLPYVDGRGEAFYLQLVGIIGGSVLQGNLLIAEASFAKRFPLESGYRAFLVDAPKARAAAVSKTLSEALVDVGMSLTPTPERLAEFHTVENTYLSIFAILGGLGLLLGSLGLGAVVLRNVLERRQELALLRAVGFRRGTLQWLVFGEHALLLALGLLVGVVAAIIAVLPALRSPGAEVPVASLSATLLGVVVSGVFWTWLATAFSVGGPLVRALRNE
jgi:ABC-type lipoprotein release transport system permease subunit